LTDPEISDRPDVATRISSMPALNERRREGLGRSSADPLPLRSFRFAGYASGMIEGRREVLILKKTRQLFTTRNAPCSTRWSPRR